MEAPIKPGETWRMTVKGHPVAQGDLSAMPLMRGKKGEGRTPVLGKGGVPVVNLTHQNADRLKPWRNEVASMACAHGWKALGLNALDEALIVRMTFYFKRPADHFGTGRNAGVLKDSAPLYPEKTGSDIDKLARAIMDSLTGIVWTDDRRVVTLAPRRRYGTPERVEIAVRRPALRTVGELRRLRDTNPLHAEALDADLQLELFGAVHAQKKPDQVTAPAA